MGRILYAWLIHKKIILLKMCAFFLLIYINKYKSIFYK